MLSLVRLTDCFPKWGYLNYLIFLHLKTHYAINHFKDMKKRGKNQRSLPQPSMKWRLFEANKFSNFDRLSFLVEFTRRPVRCTVTSSRYQSRKVYGENIIRRILETAKDFIINHS